MLLSLSHLSNSGIYVKRSKFNKQKRTFKYREPMLPKRRWGQVGAEGVWGYSGGGVKRKFTLTLDIIQQNMLKIHGVNRSVSGKEKRTSLFCLYTLKKESPAPNPPPQLNNIRTSKMKKNSSPHHGQAQKCSNLSLRTQNSDYQMQS